MENHYELIVGSDIFIVVLPVALFMVWSDFAFQKVVWLPVLIFLALSVYSPLTDRGNR